MITSTKIASLCKINHRSLLCVIEKNLPFLQIYGNCYLSTEPYSTNGNKLHKKVAIMDDLLVFIVLGKTRNGIKNASKIIPEIKSLHLGKKMEDFFYGLLSSFAKTRKISVLRQYSIQTYKIDFYIPELNLAIEYDGENHPYLDDQKREEELKMALNCAFLRIKHGEEADGIGKITEFYLGKNSHAMQMPRL